jgi:hypothetical protein
MGTSFSPGVGQDRREEPGEVTGGVPATRPGPEMGERWRRSSGRVRVTPARNAGHGEGQLGALRLGLAPAGGRGVLWANTGARGGAELASHHAGPSEPVQMNSGEAKLAKIRRE